MLDDLPFLRVADARGAMLAALETRLAPAERARLAFPDAAALAWRAGLLARRAPELVSAACYTPAELDTFIDRVSPLEGGVGALRAFRGLSVRGERLRSVDETSVRESARALALSRSRALADQAQGPAFSRAPRLPSRRSTSCASSSPRCRARCT